MSKSRITPFQARLAETGQGCTRALAQAKALVLSEALSRSGERREGLSRSGEEGSPKRACESLPMPLSRSRLSEGLPPKQGHSSRLSEGS
ncbi:hypothetical protein DEO72_LG3g624 [Vigna unguiculata]|uniref:Uncharacterized protein n=1 Tax=Vigna unguiculata TaxID=3917 RepID=A0A4D6LC82_VIGUN|nr:hypothetical protein DEO72_LG3g624 [Vigna unguiculata]